MPDLKIITAPTEQPVELEEAKAHLRVVGTDEDIVIAGYVRAARDYFERRCGYTIHQTTYEMSLDDWPDSGKVMLPRGTPVTAIDSIKYTDSDGTETTWSSALYTFDSYAYPGYVVPVYGESFPSFTPRVVNPIIVRYTAGISSTTPKTEAPDSIRQAILYLVGALHENREAETVDGMGAVVLSYGLDHFLQPHIVDYEC